jgi:predicted amidohydrolase YtcJ
MRSPRILCLLAALSVFHTPLVFGQQNLPPELIRYADTVFYNGKVVSADEKFSIHEAVAIRDGKFLAVGTNQRILALAGPNTKKYDLAGRSALPGFVDTHLHQAWVDDPPLPAGQQRTRPRFDTLQNALEDLRKIVTQAKPGEFIALSGPSNRVTAIELTADLLDQVAPNNPLYVEAQNDQVAANSQVIKMILDNHPTIPGVLRDANGKPTGQLRGAASGEAVWVLQPWPKIEDLVEPQKASLARMNQLGLTTIMGRASPLNMSVLREMERTGQLTTRIRVYHEFLRQNSEPERFLKRMGNLTGVGNDLYKIVGTTVQVVDGGGASSAYTVKGKMKVPENSPYDGFGQNKWEETGDMERSDRRNIILANRFGWTIGAMHSSGDKSNTAILEAYAEAHRERSLTGRNFGIDHGDQLTPEHYKLMKEMGVIPSVYSKAMYGNEDRIEVFGKDDVYRMQPVKSMIEYGIRPAAEADAGGAAAAPLFNIQNWVTRIDDKGWQLDPAEKVSRQEALWMYTLWAAGYTGEQDLFGSIEPGKLADVVVVNGDYMTFPERDLSKMRALLTMIGGKVVHEVAGSF